MSDPGSTPDSAPRASSTAEPTGSARQRVAEVASVFLRLGTTAFGGPAAHVALMESELVQRRRWLSREDFLDLLGAANLIPGPNSTELALFLGHKRAGWPGLIVAGFCFILPAALITTAIAWSYVQWGRLPELRGAMNAIQPVILVILGQALLGLGRSAIRTRVHGALALASAVAALLGAHELLVLLLAGVVLQLIQSPAPRRPISDTPSKSGPLGWIPALSGGSSIALASGPVTAGKLFLIFLKTGSVLFGSGYVLLAFLRADFVERGHWLTERQLLDAIAVGQFTPGPVFTTATFIGYLLHGGTGAIAATVGIFLPAFCFVAAGSWILATLRESPVARRFLDGVNLASLGLMAVVSGQLAWQVPRNLTTAVCLVGSWWAIVRCKVPSAWLILLCGVVGTAVSLVAR